MQYLSSWWSSPVDKTLRGPTGIAQQPDTPIEDVDAAIQVLQENKDAWTKVSTTERASLLDEALQLLRGETRLYGEDSVKVKGSYGSGLGEEMQSLIPAAIQLAELREAMRAGGKPAPVAVKTRPSGQHVVQVGPKAGMQVLFNGCSVDVWVTPGQEPTVGGLYRDKEAGQYRPGKVALVLGAGNQPAVVVNDVVHKLYLEDQVVLLKMNPVNDYLGPRLERFLGRFIERGWLRVAYGGAAVGQHLVKHPGIDTIHMTGSDTTFNNIVWGAPKAPPTGEPVLKKEVTGELGNFTPCVVVPGPWTDAEMAFHAHTISAGMMANGGFNCCAFRVLVLDKSWPLREKFLDAVRANFNRLPQRALWYPGSKKTYDDFKTLFPDAEELGQPVPGCSPPLLVTGLTPEQVQGSRELWAPILQEVALEGTEGDVAKFLQQAADFCNNGCWGNLAASVLIPSATQAQHAQAWEAFLEDMKYGTTMVNGPAFMGYVSGAWGGFPGNNIRNISSGNCLTRNSGLVDHPQKTVMTAPFTTPQCPWALDQSHQESTTPLVLDLVSNYQSMLGTLLRLPRVVLAQLWG